MLRRPLLQDRSFIKQIGAVGDGEGLADIVVGDDDADVAVFEFGDDVLNILDGNRVNAGKGLVQQDELRVDGQGAGDLAPAPLTSGELDAEALAHLAEVELIDELFQTVAALLFGHLRHFHHGHQIVFDGHLAEDGSFLREVSDPLLRTFVHRKVGDILVVQINPAVVGDDLAGDHIEAGRLAGTVRAEESDDLTLGNFHRNTLDDRPDAVFLDQIFAVEFHTYFVSSFISSTSLRTSSFLEIRSRACSPGI